MFQKKKKYCRENQNAHFMFGNFFSENLAVFEIMWKNMIEPDRPQVAIQHMQCACWISVATDTH
jgi:hypothetical protein